MPKNKKILNREVGVPQLPAENTTIQPVSIITVPYIENRIQNLQISNITEDVYQLDDIIFAVSCINFYDTLFKAIYPKYAETAGNIYKNTIISKFKDDLIKLLKVGNNLDTLNQYLNTKFNLSEMEKYIQSTNEVEYGLMKFICRILLIGVKVFDKNLDIIYDINIPETDYTVLMMLDGNDYYLLTKLTDKYLQAIFTVTDFV